MVKINHVDLVAPLSKSLRIFICKRKSALACHQDNLKVPLPFKIAYLKILEILNVILHYYVYKNLS